MVAVVVVGVLGLSSSVAGAQATLRSGLGGPLDYGFELDAAGGHPVGFTSWEPGGVVLLDVERPCSSLVVGRDGALGCEGAVGDPASPGSRRGVLAAFWSEVAPPGEGAEAGRVYGAWDETGERYYVTWVGMESATEGVRGRMTYQLEIELDGFVGNVSDGAYLRYVLRFAECGWEAGDASQPAWLTGVAQAFEDEFDVRAELSVSSIAALCGTGSLSTGRWLGPLPSRYRRGCGDGFVDESEGCDDGNTRSNDGCSSSCSLELDQDEDGEFDDYDNCPLLANADQLDSDGDGKGDACDLCPDTRDPTQTDEDADGVGDLCDACPDDALNDADGDGICFADDLCPDDFDPEQGDEDEDGFGDACDRCPGEPGSDEDRDAICDADDNCPDVANVTQSDIDGDGTGDVCDGDADGDGVPLEQDCNDRDAELAESWQLYEDRDGDGRGNVSAQITWCGSDENGDGRVNELDGAPDGFVSEFGDNCPDLPNPGWWDQDGDGWGDACDDDRDGDGHADVDDDNCPDVPNPGQADRDDDGLGDDCDACPRERGIRPFDGCPADGSGEGSGTSGPGGSGPDADPGAPGLPDRGGRTEVSGCAAGASHRVGWLGLALLGLLALRRRR